MSMTKREILEKIDRVDDKILTLAKGKTGKDLHPENLTVKELKEMLNAFETVYSAFGKMLEEKPKKSAHFRANGKNRRYGK